MFWRIVLGDGFECFLTGMFFWCSFEGLGDLYDRDYPMYIDSIGGVKLVSAGARHTMATTTNHVLFVWGFNCVGEMVSVEKKHGMCGVLIGGRFD